MSADETLRARIRLIPSADGSRHHLLHPLNGRFQPVDHAALDALLHALAPRIDARGVDYVLGFPEGGSIPAYAFARLIHRPVILASRLPLQMPRIVRFEQPGARLGTTQYVYGIEPGQRVLLFEDELTTGHTAVNAARALRQAGVQIDQVATLLLIDHPALRQRLAAEGLTLHVGLTLPPEYAPRPQDDGAE